MKEERRGHDDKGNGRESRFEVIDRRPSFQDDAAGGAPESRLPSYVEQLKSRAEEAESRAREISAAYRSIEQERDAFRERLSRDLERRLDIARAEMMRKVLAVIDDLDRALAAAREGGELTVLVEGVTLTRDHLMRVLGSEGVEPLETVGRPFDPSYAEAVTTEETGQAEQDNMVTAEFQKGYMLNGTLLRPARVRVARRTRTETDHEPESAQRDESGGKDAPPDGVEPPAHD